MKFGFVKVCAATTEIKVADCNFNAKKIISAVKEMADEKVSLAVFPELCVCGYTCGDLFNQNVLISSCEEAIKKICLETKDLGPLFFVGAPVSDCGRLYNCAVAICKGEILAIIPKTFLPDYGEFYEARHFTSAFKGVKKIRYGGFEVPFGTDIILRDKTIASFTVACEICEDLWVPVNPSCRHALAGANIVVNLSCSDETVGKAAYRKDLVSMQSAKLICGYVYCDAGDGESTTDMAFAGHNLICENGQVLSESKLFENGLLYAEIDVEKLDNERRRMSNSFFAEQTEGYVFVDFSADEGDFEIKRDFPTHPFVPQSKATLDERTETILKIQSKGLEKRLKHTHTKTAVIGISGGLDSALALLVTCRSFDSLSLQRSGIVCITMPGFGTTGQTFENSKKLVHSLGCTLKTIPIAESVNNHFKDIGHDPEVRDITYENSQARIRTLILMNTANQEGGLVIGTGDLSELALGWATYNGDHMSMYAVNSSVPKTLVKHLVGYEANRIGGETLKVLEDILATEISPELLPPDESGKIAQKTEDIIGPYELHDFFLYYCVRWGFSPEKILYLAKLAFKEKYSDEILKKWLINFYRRFFSQQFKRSCIPDGVKVGSVSLSPRADWRMPSDGCSDEWLKFIK